MTRVEMLYYKNIFIGFKMEGHACFNTEGPDILCASLSTASQMTVNGILDWTGLRLEDVLVEVNTNKGLLHIKVPVEHSCSVTVQQLFKSFELYVGQLEEEYKNNVKLERREQDDN